MKTKKYKTISIKRTGRRTTETRDFKNFLEEKEQIRVLDPDTICTIQKWQCKIHTERHGVKKGVFHAKP